MSFLKKVFKSVGKIAGGILGLDTGEDMGKQYEAQLRQQQEMNKLNAANEGAQVAKFDDTATQSTFGSDDTRRKKTNAGAYSNALGLKV